MIILPYFQQTLLSFLEKMQIVLCFKTVQLVLNNRIHGSDLPLPPHHKVSFYFLKYSTILVVPTVLTHVKIKYYFLYKVMKEQMIEEKRDCRASSQM